MTSFVVSIYSFKLSTAFILYNANEFTESAFVLQLNVILILGALFITKFESIIPKLVLSVIDRLSRERITVSPLGGPPELLVESFPQP
mgnify:CR=1 FL=1